MEQLATFRDQCK